MNDQDRTKFNELTAKAIRSVLRDSVVKVTFAKADGTPRTIVGTTHPDLIPLDDENKEYEAVDEASGQTQVRIYELDKKQWRSFVIERIIEFILIEDLRVSD